MSVAQAGLWQATESANPSSTAALCHHACSLLTAQDRFYPQMGRRSPASTGIARPSTTFGGADVRLRSNPAPSAPVAAPHNSTGSDFPGLSRGFLQDPGPPAGSKPPPRQRPWPLLAPSATSNHTVYLRNSSVLMPCSQGEPDGGDWHASAHSWARLGGFPGEHTRLKRANNILMSEVTRVAH